VIEGTTTVSQEKKAVTEGTTTVSLETIVVAKGTTAIAKVAIIMIQDLFIQQYHFCMLQP